MTSTSQTRREVLQSAAAAAAIVAGATFPGRASAALTESGKTWGVSHHPHFDRVMAPWVVKRFIDKNAKFVFASKIDELAPGVIPMGFPTGELSSHNEAGTCFHKVLQKYQVDDPALLVLDNVNKQAVEWYLHGTAVDMNDRYTRWSFGLMGLSDAVISYAKSDQEVFDIWFPNFDALYNLITVELKKASEKKT